MTLNECVRAKWHIIPSNGGPSTVDECNRRTDTHHIDQRATVISNVIAGLAGAFSNGA